MGANSSEKKKKQAEFLSPMERRKKVQGSRSLESDWEEKLLVPQQALGQYNPPSSSVPCFQMAFPSLPLIQTPIWAKQKEGCLDHHGKIKKGL